LGGNIPDAVNFDSVAWQSVQKRTAQGTIYEQKINFFIPVLASDRLAFLQKSDGRKCAVVLELRGNYGRVLIGTKSEPLRMLAEFESGRQAVDKQGFTVKIAGQSFTNGIAYNATEVLGDFDTENDFDPADWL